VTEQSSFVVRSSEVSPDTSLNADRGWVEMEVRWLISRQSVGAEQTVIGRTVLKPGSKHDIHKHPNAEEWEYVISGSAIKHIGDESVVLEAGDVAFVPMNVYHGLENASATEPVVTIWGYSGAASLEQAGYILPSDE
jgi:quercetin dioxygenase-like cupin family protein